MGACLGHPVRIYPLLQTLQLVPAAGAGEGRGNPAARAAGHTAGQTGLWPGPALNTLPQTGLWPGPALYTLPLTGLRPGPALYTLPLTGLELGLAGWVWRTVEAFRRMEHDWCVAKKE